MEWLTMFYLAMTMKCSMQNELKNNGMKMRMKLLLTVMKKKILQSENDVSTPEGESVTESETISIDPELKADLDCLSPTESAINTEKKSSCANILPFLVRVENMLARKLTSKTVSIVLQFQKTTTTLLTFLTSDNFFLLDICSYVLFLIRVLSCLSPVSCEMEKA